MVLVDSLILLFRFVFQYEIRDNKLLSTSVTAGTICQCQLSLGLSRLIFNGTEKKARSTQWRVQDLTLGGVDFVNRGGGVENIIESVII